MGRKFVGNRYFLISSLLYGIDIDKDTKIVPIQVTWKNFSLLFYILPALNTPQHHCPSVQIYNHIYFLLIWLATRFLLIIGLFHICTICWQVCQRSCRLVLLPLTIPPIQWSWALAHANHRTTDQMPMHQEHETVLPCSSTSPSFYSMHLKPVTTTLSLCLLHFS